MIFIGKNLWIVIVSVVFVAPDNTAAQTLSPDFGPSTFASDASAYDPPPEISPNAEQWRYSFQNGLWWYFTPERRWLYWSQGRWVEYLPPGRSNTPPYVQPPMAHRPRWRPFSAWGNRYRSNPPSVPYGSGAPFSGQPGFGVY